MLLGFHVTDSQIFSNILRFSLVNISVSVNISVHGQVAYLAVKYGFKA